MGSKVLIFENYDPALLRRIQRHIHFRLPNAPMRRELFAHRIRQSGHPMNKA